MELIDNERRRAREERGTLESREAEARRFEKVSSFVDRMTSVAISEYTPSLNPAWNAFFTRRSSPE